MVQESYNVEQVSEKLGVTIATVRKYIKDGRIKAVKVGTKYIISENNYNDFINGKWSYEVMDVN